ncbi:hypothetical protein MF672_033860 [Actinomadura sp. ATCC 31491]|uniref:Uncharacterized protein n=1 Tax=Actinomadura luzonensis TaxID=2805427 RepID=A0ABT0G2L2_9ACTN|nr:hypothetical protein [Actinomadura luzonensis]MCK2218744.1 hypothetical protein [Actinomadura luzonensis]
MATSSHIEPGSWRIVLEATEVRLTTSGRKGLRLLYAPPRLDGSFYLRPGGPADADPRPGGGLAGFDLRLPLAAPRRGEPPALLWEAAELDRDGHGRLRFGGRELRAPVSAVCAAVPGGRPYVKIVLETVFSSADLRLPATAGWLRPRPVTLRLFSEIRPATAAWR